MIEYEDGDDEEEESIHEKLLAAFGFGGGGAWAYNITDVDGMNGLKKAFEIIDGTEKTRAGMEKAAYAGIPGGTSKRPGGGLDRPAKKAFPGKYATDLLANGGTPPSGKGVVGRIPYIDDYIDDTVAKANELAHAKADVMWSLLMYLLGKTVEELKAFGDDHWDEVDGRDSHP